MAYVFDFGADTRLSGRNVAKKPKGLDAFLKAEVRAYFIQSNAGSRFMEKRTNGSTSYDVKLTLLDNLPAHHFIHECNEAHQR